MPTRSSEEILDYYKRNLGDDFGNTYYHIVSEWSELWLLWKQFRNLFCQGPERVTLLNNCGAAFFARVDSTFLESTFLSICRLSDPVESFGKPNLTVRRLPQFANFESQKSKMDELLEDIAIKSKFARDWRNRRISHSDYHLKLSTEEATPLKSATIREVDDAINAIFKIISYISLEFLKSHLEEEVIDPLNNEMVLLDRLYLGDQEFNRELQDLKDRRILPSKRPEWLINQ